MAITPDKIYGVTPAATGWRFVLLIDGELKEDAVAVWFSMGDEDGISYLVPGTADETGTVWPTEADTYDDGVCVGLFGPTASDDEIGEAVALHTLHLAKREERLANGGA